LFRSFLRAARSQSEELEGARNFRRLGGFPKTLLNICEVFIAPVVREVFGSDLWLKACT
jgi:hypothetical protein